MLQVLVDADTVLEALLNRSQFVIASEELVAILQNRQVKGYISELGLAKIFSVASRLRNSETAEEVVSEMCVTLCLCPISSNLLQQARSLNIEDFESAVEVACAIAQEIGAIVTHKPKDFEGATGLVVLSVNDLLQRQHLQNSLEQQYTNDLQQWFQGSIDKNWHSLEALGLKSSVNFNFRSAPTTICGGKLLDLGIHRLGAAAQVILLVEVEKVTELDTNLSITVTSPQGGNLPSETKLELLDETGEVIMQVQASHNTSSIKLRCIGQSREHFSIRLSLRDVSVTEGFVV